MKRNNGILKVVIPSACILLLILDTKTASIGVIEGIKTCLNVIIPALFPFFMATTYLNQILLGMRIPGLLSIAKWLHIPEGGDSLLLLGLIGGYPVGAQLIAETYKNGSLTKRTAQILLGYCSNAGPAFIFGVTGILFSSRRVPLFLWLIHILSALITGWLLPMPNQTSVRMKSGYEISVTTALRRSMSVCSSVCGWIITFKIILAYLQTYVFSRPHKTFMIIITGLLELSNGCIGLITIENDAIKFILSSVFLAFGGLCVMMQTSSVTGDVGLGLYIPGKFLQAAISLLTSVAVSKFLFPSYAIPIIPLVVSVVVCIFTVIIVRGYAEKRCGNYAKNHV